MDYHFGLSQAERSVYDAAYWIKGHPSSFRALMHYMHLQVDKGVVRTTRSDAMAYAREAGLNISDFADLKRDHNLYPSITRYMVMLRPRLARTIRFRKSKVDDVDMAEIWHEVVSGSTTFLACNRKEAEQMVLLGDAAAS